MHRPETMNATLRDCRTDVRHLVHTFLPYTKDVMEILLFEISREFSNDHLYASCTRDGWMIEIVYRLDPPFGYGDRDGIIRYKTQANLKLWVDRMDEDHLVVYLTRSSSGWTVNHPIFSRIQNKILDIIPGATQHF